MNKKGVVSMPIIIMILLVVGLMLVMTSFIFSKMKVALQAEPTFNNTDVTKAFNNTSQTYSNFDTTILFIFIGFILALIITSSLIRTNQIFLVIMIIFLIILLVLAMVVSNAWDATIKSNAEFQSFVEMTYPKTNFILGNLPPIIFITDLMALVALFSRRSEVI